MSTKTELRRELFKIYAANFALYSPIADGRFLCPIRGEFFDEDSVEGPNPKVNLAHVYPEKCGGTLVTLTSESANSDIGSEFDSHVVKEKKTHDAWNGSGDESIHTQFHLHNFGATVRGEVSNKPTGLEFHVVRKQSNPSEISKIDSRLRDMSQPLPEQLNFTFTMPWYDERKLKTGLLHSAYLAMFWAYGYEYPLYVETEWIRQILNGRSSIDEVRVPFIAIPKGELARSLTIDPQEAYFRPCFARLPEDELNCLAVAFPSPASNQDGRIVLLPGFCEEGQEHYQKIMTLTGVNRVLLTVDTEVSQSLLADPNFAFFSHHKWKRECNAASQRP